MKRIITTFTTTLILYAAAAQQVPTKIVVEHFTNTYCSICASRNPGMYGTISQFPEILHIAYHTSSPYASCTLNQYNKSENDGRANYYNVYGGTPRIVLQGLPVPSASNYADNMLYQSAQNAMSSFRVTTNLKKTGSTTAEVSVVIKKTDASNLNSLQLYAAVVEDTLFFNAPNGEDQHYDVFRKSVWGAPQTINAPTVVGDSVAMTQTITVDAVWQTNRTYVTAIIQDDNKNVVQAERSQSLDNAVGVSDTKITQAIGIYPNPASNALTLTGNINGSAIINITSVDGKSLYTGTLGNNKQVNISDLAKGVYFLSISDGVTKKYTRFLKR